MRKRIIDTAKKRFFTYGYRKVTMDEIASDLGISKKTLYKHFAGKEEVACEVLGQFQEEMARLFEEKKKTISDPVERFEVLVVEITRLRSSMNNRFPADIKQDIPDLWREIERFRQVQIMKNIAENLEEGIKKGRIREGLNTQIATKLYLAAIQSIMQPDLLEQMNISVEEALSNISSIFLNGVKKKET
ncbi:MAG: TetR/AcrR family transcriptional regulator [Deltaproteobacteria bacterium]|nr:TetR/AcrR family transcriptional regulator [Deltaproteobacteria bacterium]